MNELQVVLASRDEIKVVSDLLIKMQQEVAEFEMTILDVQRNIEASWDKNIFWFLFKDMDRPVGCCHLSPIYTYYTPYPYYYIGGVYLNKSYRGRGLFKKNIDLLKRWISDNGGGYLMSHIHRDNKKSQRAFMSAGFCYDTYQVQFTDLIEPNT